MSSRPLDPDTLLSVELGAIMSRDRYTSEPGPVIAQLRETAGVRVDLLAAEVGSWVGFYRSEHTRLLADALLEAFSNLDLQPWIEVGRKRQHTPPHSTPGR